MAATVGRLTGGCKLLLTHCALKGCSGVFGTCHVPGSMLPFRLRWRGAVNAGPRRNELHNSSCIFTPGCLPSNLHHRVRSRTGGDAGGNVTGYFGGWKCVHTLLCRQKPILKSKQGAFQIVDTVNLFQRISKFSKQVVMVSRAVPPKFERHPACMHACGT